MADLIEVTVEEAQVDFERLLDAVAFGHVVVITRNGAAAVELRRVREDASR